MLFLLAVSLPSFTSAIVAQSLPLDAGARVRVAGCGIRTGYQEGTFDGLRNDTLFLRANAASAVCSVSSVRTLEVFAGRSSHWKRGAVIGAILGGVGLAGFFALACYALDDSAEGCQTGEAAAGAALGLSLGGITGGLFGGGIGFLFKTEKWELVSIPPLLFPVGVSPTGRADFGLRPRSIPR